MTKADADKALQCLKAIGVGPNSSEERFRDEVEKFIHDVRDQLPYPHRPFGSKEAGEALRREVQAAAERGAGPDSHKTTGRGT